MDSFAIISVYCKRERSSQKTHTDDVAKIAAAFDETKRVAIKFCHHAEKWTSFRTRSPADTRRFGLLGRKLLSTMHWCFGFSLSDRNTGFYFLALVDTADERHR